jgi:hypothetical protein
MSVHQAKLFIPGPATDTSRKWRHIDRQSGGRKSLIIPILNWRRCKSGSGNPRGVGAAGGGQSSGASAVRSSFISSRIIAGENTAREETQHEAIILHGAPGGTSRLRHTAGADLADRAAMAGTMADRRCRQSFFAAAAVPCHRLEPVRDVFAESRRLPLTSPTPSRRVVWVAAVLEPVKAALRATWRPTLTAFVRDGWAVPQVGTREARVRRRLGAAASALGRAASGPAESCGRGPLAQQ